jgi:hypothetical protein
MRRFATGRARDHLAQIVADELAPMDDVLVVHGDTRWCSTDRTLAAAARPWRPALHFACGLQPK